MPSTKVLFALRLEKPLADRLTAKARADGRSPSNYVAQLVRKTLAADARSESNRVTEPSSIFGPPVYVTRAPAQKERRLVPSSMPGFLEYEGEPNGPLIPNPDPSTDEVDDSAADGLIGDAPVTAPAVPRYDRARCQSLFESYLAKGMDRAEAKAKTHRMVPHSKDWVPEGDDPAASTVRYTPATHEIPAGWVNEYGLTLAQQNVVGTDDTLAYGPPGERANGGVAH